MDVPSSQQDGSLLKKYDIPVNHLDFQYVENCTNGRELEKILQVLQSGQEGHFPDLIRATEARLAQIKPNSKYIRKATPVLDKKFLDKDELKDLSDDLSTWLKDVSKINQELDSARKRSSSSTQPDVRKCDQKPPEEKEANKTKRIKSTDYSSWDKYDPDTEILKMDIHDEKMRNDVARKEKDAKKKEREVKFSEFATKAEASFEANREREKGNECFKAGEYTQAIIYYTNSINYMPSANSYNNRAIARIKLKDYKKAQGDCQNVLRYEPNNIKALLRLAQCHEALGDFEEGLNVSERIIQIDPNNTTAQNFINKLRNQLNIKIHAKTRMKIVETVENIKGKTSKVKIVELDDNNKEIKECEPDLSRRPSRSILKKKHVLLPIPGPSTMPEPYYVMVENVDPKIIKKQEYILNNRPQMICLNNIDTSLDESECLEVHIKSSQINLLVSKENSEENKENVGSVSIENLIAPQETLEIVENKVESHRENIADFIKSNVLDVALLNTRQQCFSSREENEVMNKNKLLEENSDRVDENFDSLQIIKCNKQVKECVEENVIEVLNKNNVMEKTTFKVEDNLDTSQTIQLNEIQVKECVEKVLINDLLEKNPLNMKDNFDKQHFRSNELQIKGYVVDNLTKVLDKNDLSKENLDSLQTIQNTPHNKLENLTSNNNGILKKTPENVDSLQTTDNFPCHKKEDLNHQNTITEKSCQNETTALKEQSKSVDENKNLDESIKTKTENSIQQEIPLDLDLTKQNDLNSEITENFVSKLSEDDANDKLHKTNYDTNNNNKDKGYFNARKWNNVRGKNGRRYDKEIETENRRNDNNNIDLQNQDKSEPHVSKIETINIEELHMPYSFLKMWNSIGHDSTYSKHAEVLRNLDYNRLPEVIGYKLDGTMLSAIVSALYYHFMVPHEIERVFNLLNNITRMQRFRIVSMFLSTTDKSRVKSLCTFLQQHGKPLPENIMRLYFK